MTPPPMPNPPMTPQRITPTDREQRPEPETYVCRECGKTRRFADGTPDSVGDGTLLCHECADAPIYTLFVDGGGFHTPDAVVSGAHVKGFVGKDQMYNLYREDEDGDQPVGDLESVSLTGGVVLHFYTVPRTDGG